MSTYPSGGGAWVPQQDQTVTGSWVFGSSTTTPTVDFTLATVVGLTPGDLALTSGNLFVGNASNLAVGVALSGDATLANTGAITIGANKITAAKIASGGIGYAAGVGGTVTQITSSSTGVTLNKVCGTIVTVALTTAHGAHEQFTVTNSVCAAVTDVVLLSTTYAAGAHGAPVLQAVNVTAGTFDIIIYNADSANAFNAAMTINFVVIPSVAA